MERLNLNIPENVRKRLKTIAARQDRTESEVARELLMTALEAAERDEFYAQVAASQTPELHKRQLQILDAFERLDG
jgi:plasmid stability protein